MKKQLTIVWLAAVYAASLFGCCSHHGASESVIAPIGSWQSIYGPSHITLTLQKDGTFILHRDVHGAYEMIDSTHVRIDLVTSNGTQSTTYPFSTSGGELTLLFEGIPAVLKFQRAPESVIAPLGSWQNADGQRWTFQKDGTFISHTEVRGLYKMLDSDHIRISSVTRKGIKSRSTYQFSYSGEELTLTFNMASNQEATKLQRILD